MMPKEVLEEIFVQRERLAERTVRQVRDSVLTGPPSHTLFIGPRGIGKTHLVSLVYHRLKALPELKERLVVAWLPEDEGGIASFLDFLLAVLHALLADDPDLAVWLTPKLDALYDSREAEAEAKALLMEAVGDRSLLLLVENLDQIFAGLRDAGQKALRAFLQETRSVTLVATAQSLFGGVSRHASPFYGFFRVEHLLGLNLTEAVDLLIKIARRDNKPDLVEFLQSPAGRARVRAVDHLVAGNPRLYVIFSEFLTRESLDELVPPFLDMLDGLTPYYQAKMHSLSPQQRKLVDFLSGIPGALPVKEIGRRTLIGATTAASQLKLLRENGYVRIAYSQGRETYYELKEPLMRLCLDVKKQRGEPIKLFVEFLRLWYPKDELERRFAALPDSASFTHASLREALRLSASEENPLFAACRTDYMQYMKQGDKEKAKQVLEELQAIGGPANFSEQLAYADHSQAIQILNNVRELFNKDHFDKALTLVDEYLKLIPESTAIWNLKGIALFGLKRYEEALLVCEKSLSLLPDDATMLFFKGIVLSHLNRNEEALATCDASLILDTKNMLAYYYKGKVLFALERPEEALTALDECLSLSPDYVDAWQDKSRILICLDRSEEALLALNRCLTLDPKHSESWLYKGLVLGNVGQIKDSVYAFGRYLALEPQDADVWYGKGLALSDLGHSEQALASYDQSLALAPENTDVWNSKGTTLFDLDRLEEALSAFDRALALQPSNQEWHTARIETLFAQNRWREGFEGLPVALSLPTDSDESLIEATADFVQQLLKADMGQWSVRAKTFITTYATHNQTPALGQALVQSVPGLRSPLFSPDARRLWYETWKTQAGGRSEFTLPLRLLDVAVRYLNSGDTLDTRILLELASEERSLLGPVLGIKDTEEDED